MNVGHLIDQNSNVTLDMKAIKLNDRVLELLSLVDHNPVDCQVYQNLIIASHFLVFFS
jgi:hypothetical protein